MTIIFGNRNTTDTESGEFDFGAFLRKYYVELGLVCFSIFFIGQVVGIRKVLIRR